MLSQEKSIKTEYSFQKSMVRLLRIAGLYVMEGAQAPGHPDLTVLGHDNQWWLLELKDITGCSLGGQMIGLFTRNQLPWMVRFDREKHGPVYLLMRQGIGCYLYIVDTPESVSDLMNFTVGQVIEKSMKFTIMQAVSYILRG